MIRKSNPKMNITNGSQNYVVHLAVIRNLDTGRYWSVSQQDWFIMPNENISTWRNKESAKSEFEYLLKRGFDVSIREMEYQEGIPSHKYGRD